GCYCRPLAWLALIPGPAGRGRMPSLPVVGRGLITARTAAVTAGHGLDRARTTGEGPAAWLQRHPESRKDLRAATGSPDIPVPGRRVASFMALHGATNDLHPGGGSSLVDQVENFND